MQYVGRRSIEDHWPEPVFHSQKASSLPDAAAIAQPDRGLTLPEVAAKVDTPAEAAPVQEPIKNAAPANARPVPPKPTPAQEARSTALRSQAADYRSSLGRAEPARAGHRQASGEAGARLHARRGPDHRGASDQRQQDRGCRTAAGGAGLHGAGAVEGVPVHRSAGKERQTLDGWLAAAPGCAAVPEGHRGMSRFSDAIKAGREGRVQSRQLFDRSPTVWWSVRDLFRNVRSSGIHQKSSDGVIAFRDCNRRSVRKAEQTPVICLGCHSDNLSDRNRNGIAGTVAAKLVKFDEAHFHRSSLSRRKTVCHANKMHKDLVSAA